MRYARSRYLLRSLSLCLLLAAAAACSDDDAGPVEATATVMGVLLDPEGNPLPNAPIAVFVYDTERLTPVEDRTLSTDGSGQFSTTFAFSPETFPVSIQVLGKPPLGSGIDVVRVDTMLTPEPGRITDTLTVALNAVQVEPPVNDILPASFAQSSLLGHYFGQSVAPLEYYVTVYLDLDVTGTAGSVSGRYDIDYSATAVTPDGTILGAVLLDTLRLRLMSDTIPDQPRHVASLKAIATSSAADTLIATPDPCTGQGCWLFTAPIRLIRAP